MIEALRPTIEKLRNAMEDPRAKRIQSWVEYFSSDPNKARIIHNRAMDFLKKYHQKTTEVKDSDEIYKFAIQVANFNHGSDPSNFPPFSKDVYSTETKIDIGADKNVLKEQVMQYSKDVLIASLFSVNRLDLGDRLSKSMELDQIKAVIKCVIDNNHIQMGTGQGKSSTVIPISSIVNALTSKEKSSLVVSINKNLVGELENKTRELIYKAKKNGLELSIDTNIKNQEELRVGETIKTQMMKEALTSKEVGYSAKLNKDLFTTYWGETLDIANKQKTNLFDSSTVTFMSKDDFVFKVIHEGKDFIESCPKVFFDEIDAPYVTGETYQSTQEDIYISPENIRAMTTQYVLNKLVLSKLNPKEDFKVFKGKGVLNDEVQKKLMNINWKKWLNGTIKDSELDMAFEESISVIGDFLHFNEPESFGLREMIRHNLTENLFLGVMVEKEPENNPNPIFINVMDSASNLADAHYNLNKLYINEGDQIVVRSSYFDQLLENHKFDPYSHIAMLALANKFNIVNLRSKASESAKFPTIISLLGNKLIGFSGTLKQRDLRTGKPQVSSLAKLLKDFTGNEVYEVRSPELKNLPPPIITEDIEEMKKMLIELLKKNINDQPILLLSNYDTKTTQDIFSQVSQSFRDSLGVEILPSIPSDPKKLEEYYKELKKKTKDLADGKVKILVSTGSVGIGADITQTENTFPDLKIGILGLPENESQIKQYLGRRRKEGDDYFWIVDKESLRERATWLDDQKTMLIKAHLTEGKALEQIDKLPYTDDKKNIDFILRLIHEAHLTTLTDESFTVDYDQMFQLGFAPQATKILEEKIKSEFFKEVTDWEKDSKSRKKLSQLISIFGLPGTLYNELVKTENTIGIKSNSTAEYMAKLNFLQTNVIKKEIDFWFESTKEEVEFLYHNLYGDGQKNINQILITGSPEDATFHSVNNVNINHLERETRQAKIGFATLSSDQFPKSVPAIRFVNDENILIYLLKKNDSENVDFAYIYI